MSFDDYKVVLCRQDDGSWVAEIPAGRSVTIPLHGGRDIGLPLFFKILLPRSGSRSSANSQPG